MSVIASHYDNHKSETFVVPVATRIIAIVADALVLAMTWVKTASLLKQAHGVNVRPRLITMFLRDGRSCGK